jgi:phage shock protein A
MQTSIRARPSSTANIRDATAEPTTDKSLQLSILETEVLGLRQTLAEVKASRDALRKEIEDLRRDRDHWRKLAEPNEPKSRGGSKTWFCGRASASG